ncbi:MAG: YqeG family HAD IIIA-type phosphatase, partial [Fimbriimonas sp.]
MVFHPFTPAHAVNTLQEIDLDVLWASGKRLLLVDVDNTLVQWKQENFAAPVLEWIAKAKQMGFNICLVSNTNRLDRLARLKELLGVETVRGRFKPSRAMFRLAMIKFKNKPEETIMIGDQLMTDILGANRAGIEAYWVRKMEGREFGPTAINRKIERFF